MIQLQIQRKHIMIQIRRIHANEADGKKEKLFFSVFGDKNLLLI